MTVITWIQLMTKRQLKNPLFVCLLLLVPLCAFLMTNLLPASRPVEYLVGIYQEGDDPLSQTLTLALTQQKDGFTFVEYEDTDKMKQDVMNSTLVCGYMLPPNLSKKATLNGNKTPIQVLMQASATIQPAINEIVYSELLKLQGPTILWNYVQSTELFSENEPAIQKELEDKYRAYTVSSSTFHIDYITADSQSALHTDPSMTSIAFPIRGVLSILILLSGIFGSVLWRKDQEKGVFQVFSAKKRRLTRVLYIGIPTFLFGISAFVTLLFCKDFTNWPKEILAMITYLILVCIYSCLLMYMVKKSSHMTAFIPILMLGCLIFCPIFINAGLFIPAVKIVEKLFVPYYYLQFFA